jgi:hypothetical protein
MRNKLRRLERAVRGHLESFELEDGRRHYYDRTTTSLFLHCLACIKAQAECKPFPEPPETVRAIARAKDRRAALDQVCSPYADIIPYDTRVLVERGEIVPRSLVVGYELGEPIPDLSE